MRVVWAVSIAENLAMETAFLNKTTNRTYIQKSNREIQIKYKKNKNYKHK